jgi:hypothetical protein
VLSAQAYSFALCTLRGFEHRLTVLFPFFQPTLEEIAKIFDGENAEVADVDLKAAGVIGTRASASDNLKAEDEEKAARVNEERV